VIWPFIAVPKAQERFSVSRSPLFNISGRWATTFTNASGRQRPAIAEFKQKGSVLTGSFLTPSGDYRYLEGVVSGDSIYLSAFDGSHVYLFTAHVESGSEIKSGVFFAGFTGKEQWEASFDPSAALPDVGNTPAVLDRNLPIDFRFPDLDSNMISLSDERFRNKVIVIQLMGSWCPNCMDETKFLSEYYTKNRSRGVEIIALAYEYSTDFPRSRNSLVRFRDRFAVEYPMLITGVRVSDSLRTEKTLPNITAVNVFPTSLYIGKDRKIRKIETGFNGPGTGIHYDAYIKEFEETVEALLKE
jgi:thiol-disulfide isomerase/thioredoxin